QTALHGCLVGWVLFIRHRPRRALWGRPGRWSSGATRPAPQDSRHFGYAPRSALLGVVATRPATRERRAVRPHLDPAR
ncbi:hypothetical protein, partial [Streptomyces violascens]|uniref:hypothetical protein n=1 Tax=Streptomyces violascens TaxID=67381 RepID=UPI00367E65A6